MLDEMLEETRRRADGSVMRRLLRALSSVFIVTGLLLIGDAVLTVTWQEPVSLLLHQREQGRLKQELADLERTPLAPVERRALSSLPPGAARLAFSARAFRRHVKEGQPLGRIRIPRIGLSEYLIEGTDAHTDLAKGPGHYPATPLPGLHGTVGVAGHRTTYGAPFRHIDRLGPGDLIRIEMPYGIFTYRVESHRIVPPTALYVTKRVGYDRLILSACHPLYSASRRYIVFARLERAQARGAALL